jgi:EmrB/QacA subfamily drug resistance transporter
VSSERAVLGVLFGGVLMGALDIAIVGPALPAIRAAFDVGGRALPWVFSTYVLFYVIGTPLLAKRSDRRGRRAVFVQSLALFAAGSLLVAGAQTYFMLLAGRAVQAFGAGGLFPVAAAVIADTVPYERRGRTLGMIGATFGVAFLLGPLLGGLLLHWSWRWLFLINVPIAALLIVTGLRVLPQQSRAEARAFDARGAALLSLVLAAVVIGVSQIDTEQWAANVLSWRVLPWLVFVALGAPLLWHVEKRAVDPVLPPALLSSVQLKLVGGIALAAGSVEAGMVFLPDVAVQGLGVDASVASFMMLPLVLTLAVGAPVAGQLLDRIGARAVVQAGLALTAVGLALLALAPLDLLTFYGAGAVIGLGLSALLGAPLRYITLQEAGEERRGSGQGLLTLCVSIGQLVGSALIGGLLGSTPDTLGGYRHALLAVGVVCVLALLLSLALRGKVDYRPAAG